MKITILDQKTETLTFNGVPVGGVFKLTGTMYLKLGKNDALKLDGLGAVHFIYTDQRIDSVYKITNIEVEKVI